MKTREKIIKKTGLVLYTLFVLLLGTGIGMARRPAPPATAASSSARVSGYGITCGVAVVNKEKVHITIYQPHKIKDILKSTNWADLKVGK